MVTWTKEKRAAFARKMKAARAAKRGRRRRKNPTKAEVKAAASRIAKAAGKLAWRGAKLTGRVGRESAKAAAREVKASICRPRAKNPKRKKVWTAAMRASFARRMIRYRKRPRARRLAKRGRTRLKNPFRVVIRAVPKGLYRKTGPARGALYYDGRNFTAAKERRRYFSSVAPAAVVARQLLHRYPVLRHGYVVTLNSA